MLNYIIVLNGDNPFLYLELPSEVICNRKSVYCIEHEKWEIAEHQRVSWSTRPASAVWPMKLVLNWRFCLLFELAAAVETFKFLHANETQFGGQYIFNICIGKIKQETDASF